MLARSKASRASSNRVLLLLLLLCALAVSPVQAIVDGDEDSSSNATSTAVAEENEAPAELQAGDGSEAPASSSPEPSPRPATSAARSSRVVVTLNEYNACEVAEAAWGAGSRSDAAAVPLCGTVAKCYGRRLILNLDGCSNAEDDAFVEEWVQSAIADTGGSVSRVERDKLTRMHASSQREGGWFARTRIISAAGDADSVDVNASEVVVEGDGMYSFITNYQWNMEMIKARELWVNFSSRGENTTIAVLDSGMAQTALDAFSNRVVHGYDFVSDDFWSKDGDGRDANYYDPGDSSDIFCPGDGNSWHGTAVASVAAGNFEGFEGVAPGASVMPVRVLGLCGIGYASDLADGIVWAAGGVIDGVGVNNGDANARKVILMSLSGEGACPSFMQTAVDLAVRNGVAIFAAAGNDPMLNASDQFPGNCRGVVTVGAWNWRKEEAFYSSKNPDMFMPGGDGEKPVPVLINDLYSGVWGMIGTSFAAPHAAGLWAVRRGELCTAENGCSVDDSENAGGNVEGCTENCNQTVHTATCPAGQFRGTGGAQQRFPPNPWPCCSCQQLMNGITYSVKASSFMAGQDAVKVFDRLADDANNPWMGAPNEFSAVGGINTAVSSSPYFATHSDFRGTYIVIDMGPGFVLSRYGFTIIDTYEPSLPRKWRIYGINDPSVWLLGGSCSSGIDTTKAWIVLDSRENPAISSGISYDLISNNIVSRFIAIQINQLKGSVWSFAMIGELLLYGAYPSCVLCPTGTFSNAGSTSSANCTLCPAGTYASAPGSSTCTPCPGGTFSTATGATSNATCNQTCASGFYAPPGSSACTACPAGGYSEAAPSTCVPTSVVTSQEAVQSLYIFKTDSACAKLASGMLKCWGANSNGELGLGDTTDRGLTTESMGNNLPYVSLGVDVVQIKEVSQGYDHACCAITTSGNVDKVRCWGKNALGSLGLGIEPLPGTYQYNIGDNAEMGAQLQAADLGSELSSGQISVTQVVSGNQNNCVLFSNGKIKCWGYNYGGIFGYGTFSNLGTEAGQMGNDLPFVDLGSGLTAKQISIGSTHICAILSTDALKCWGDNWNGYLGVGAINTFETSVSTMDTISVGSGLFVKSVSCANTHTCAILSNNKVKCWGQGSSGRLGIGNTNTMGDGPSEMGDNLPYAELGTGMTAKSISAGHDHSCAILSDDSIKCWGGNSAGQLGLGDNQNRGDAAGEMGDSLPRVNIGSGRKAVRVVASYFRTCAQLDDGTVKCWGTLQSGTLGIGTTTAVNSIGDNPNEMGDMLPSVNLGGKTSLSACPIVPGPSNCTLCPAGTSSSASSATSNATCQPCAAGTFSAVAGSANCSACSAGSYSASAGGTSCDKCPAGSYSSAVGAASASACLSCQAGTYSSSSGSAQCTLCPAGTFSTQSSTTSASACQQCPAGTFSLAGSAACTACPLGQYAFAGSGGCAARIEAAIGDVFAGIGYTLCAIVNNTKELKCWGSNINGKLGLGDTNDRGDNPNEMGSNLPAVNLGTGVFVRSMCFGWYHSCAILSSDSMKCWGGNSKGQLGYGDYTQRNSPPADLSVPFGGKKPVSIACGGQHTCAVLFDGSLMCWGWGDDGQIGDGAWSTRTSPVAVNIGTGRTARKVQAGNFHTCVLMDNGQVKCWGKNGAMDNYGALGYGDNVSRNSPPAAEVNLGAGRSVKDLYSGSYHNCAILDNGVVKCWGYYTGTGVNTFDVGVGDASNEMGDYLPALDLKTTLNLVQLSTGQAMTCLLFEDGSVRCFGTAGSYQTGTTLQTTTNSVPTQPVNLGPGISAVKIVNTPGNTCILTNTSQIKCWGTGSNGVLGTGDTNLIRYPDLAPTIDVGDFTCQQCTPGKYVISNCLSCGACPAGTFSNASNSLNCTACPAGSFSMAGNATCTLCPAGTYTSSSNSTACTRCPQDFFSAAVGATSLSTCQACPSGTLSLAGSASCASSFTPSLVAFANSSGSTFHACMLMQRGLVKCWGHNGAGQLGYGDNMHRGDNPNELGSNLPFVNTGTAGPVTQICTGYFHTCALFSGINKVRCWGVNNAGQLGLGHMDTLGNDSNEIADSLPFVDLGTSQTIVKLTCGKQHNCVLFQDASMKCWGDNFYGQLALGHKNRIGDGPDEMGTFLPFVNLGSNQSNVRDIKCTYDNTCALYADGKVKCWGNNAYYQVGTTQNAHMGDDASEVGNNIPFMNLGAGVMLSSLDFIFLGELHSCAATSAQGIKCWGTAGNSGSNFYEGVLGYGDFTDRTSPGAEIALGVPITDVELGQMHTCVLLSGNSIKCWGSNADGQQGNGMTTAVLSPPASAISFGTGFAPKALFTGYKFSCAMMDSSSVKCWGDSAFGATGQGSTTDVFSPSTASAISFGTFNCSVCQPGSYSASKCMGCIQCSAGTYSSTLDSPSCQACGAGTFSASTGATNCTSCPAGRYSSALGATSNSTCQMCPAGSFSALAGATDASNCTACPAGTYTSAPGSSACQSCPAGTFSAQPGSTACTPCPIGQYAFAGSAGCAETIGSTVLELANMSISSYSCALFQGGKIKCWGANWDGQLGLGDTLHRGDGPNEMGFNLPFVDTGSAGAASQICTGNSHTCILIPNINKVRCWGYNDYGQLGLGHKLSMGDSIDEVGDSLPFVDLGTTEIIKTLTCGSRHTCVLFQSNGIKCWGLNSNGVLGLGTTTHMGDNPGEMGINLPYVDVGDKSNIKEIRAFVYNTCALFTSGNVKCWGYNDNYQLSSTQNQHIGDSPSETGTGMPFMNLGAGVTLASLDHIFLGIRHSCAVTSAQGVKCWGVPGVAGSNVYEGILGYGDHVTRTFPGDEIALGDTIKSLKMGIMYTCVFLESNGIKCWGSNADGQLGNGGTSAVLSPPASSVSFGSGLKAWKYMGGRGHSCAILDNKKDVKCWGDAATGAVGQGTTTDVSDPSTVNALDLGSFTCQQCVAGQYVITNCFSCGTCPAGTFSSGNNSLNCSLCPAGTYASSPGGTSNASCQACPAGTYSSSAGSPCVRCPAGTYSPAPGQTTCTSCPADTFAPLLGASSAGQCVTSVSMYQGPRKYPPGGVPIWYGSAANLVTVTGQAFGNGVYHVAWSSWNDDTGQYPKHVFDSSTSSLGVWAPSQYHSTTREYISASDLNSDGYKGDWITLRLPTNLALTSMSINTLSFTNPNAPKNYRIYAKKDGESSWTVLATVSNAEYQPYYHEYTFPSGNADAYNSFALEVSALYSGQNLALAEVSFTGMEVNPCPAGTYNYPNTTVCVYCPAGTSSSAVGATSNATCAPCPAGSYAPSSGSSTCTPCPAGSFSTVTGATNASVACSQLCPAGTYSQAGSASCTPCPVGTFSAAVGATGNSTCQACQIGTFASSINGSAACTSCPTGQTTLANSSSSSAACVCVAGRFWTMVQTWEPAGEFPPNAMTSCPMTQGKYTYLSTQSGSWDNAYPAVNIFKKDGYGSQWASGGNYGGGNPSGAALFPNQYYGEYVAVDMGGEFLLNSYRMLSDKNVDWRIYGSSNSSAWSAAGSCSNSAVNPSSSSWFLIDFKQSAAAFRDGVQVLTPNVAASAGRTARFLAVQITKVESNSVNANIAELYLNGQYAGPMAPGCASCPAGSFASGLNSSACTPCPAGTIAAGSGSTSCSACPIGFYSVQGSSSCTQCPAGTYASTAGTAQCTPCPLGTFSTAVGATSNATCQSCPIGTFASTAGSTNCTNCSAGQTTLRTGSTSSSADCVCVAGRYLQFVQTGEGPGIFPPSGLSSAQCPMKQGNYTYVTGASTDFASYAPNVYAFQKDGSTNAWFSGQNSYSSGIPSASSPTFMGSYKGEYVAIDMGVEFLVQSYKLQTQDPIAYDWNVYGASGAGVWNNPSSCTVNAVSPSASWSLIDSRTDQTSYNQNTVFTPNAASVKSSRYLVLQIMKTQVVTSPSVRTYARVDEWTITGIYPGPIISSCNLCSPGTYTSSANTSTCAPCQAGTYTSTSGSTSCIQCPAGTYTSLQGASLCTPCPAGTYSASVGATNSSTCLPCPLGTYSDASGSTACTSCGSGQDTLNTSSSRKTDCVCVAGRFWTMVRDQGPTGVYPPNAMTSCPMTQGSYTYVLGTSDNYDNNADRSMLGAFRKDGTATEWWSKWWYEYGVLRPDKGVTFLGTYRGEYLAIDMGGDFVVQSYSITPTFPRILDWNVLGASGTGVWDKPSSCATVAVNPSSPSWFLLDAKTNQASYSESTIFTPSITSSAPARYLVFQIVRNENNALGISKLAEWFITGYYVGSLYLGCGPCPAGTFASSVNSTACTPCPAGTYSLAGSSSCTRCPVGTYSPNASATSSAACVNCPSGSYANETGSTMCRPCDPGLFSAQGAFLCAQCATGKYAKEYGSTNCTACPPGTYANYPGTAICTPCALGMFSNATGASTASTCSQCPPGTFANATGSTACRACADGSYTANFASSSCELCPKGTATKK